MNKITDKVYLGDCFGAEDEAKLKSNKITHVFSCCGNLSPKYKDKSIIQKIIELEDSEEVNIFQYFHDAILFIENSNRIFVHCFAGGICPAEPQLKVGQDVQQERRRLTHDNGSDSFWD